LGRSKGQPRTQPERVPAPPARVRAQHASPILPRTWRGVEYRPLPAGSPDARRLFSYAAAWAPPPGPGELAWGAWVKEEPERMVGALLVEPSSPAGMIYGPVVVESEDPLEVAAQLVASALPDATAAGLETLFVRPQGLDRVWVRFGFIPVPEADLPLPLRGRPGSGLFAWRGGSALWSSRRTDTFESDRLR